jgi:transposase-like protein
MGPMTDAVISANPYSIRLGLLFMGLEKAFGKHKHAVGTSCRMDETYIKVNGISKYLYRAVDKQGEAVDFLLTAKRDAAAARRFLDKAIRNNASPDTVTMDRAALTKLRSTSRTQNAPFRSRSGKSSISTISWSRIIVRLNALPARCSASSHSERREPSSPASNSCP